MTRRELCRPWEHLSSRRRWLSQLAGAAGAASLGAMALPRSAPALADALAPRDKQVLFIWIDGGMSQLESWDPKPHSPFGGPFRAIPTSVPGVHFSELLPRTARLMHHLAVVRNLCTQDNSHSAGVARIQRGDPKNRGVTYPYFGSAVARLLGPGQSGLPPYVWIKPLSGGFKYQDAGFLGPQYGALAFGDGRPPENLLRHESLTPEQDEERHRLRREADRRYAAGRRPANTEAQSYVYDMARKLMQRTDLFDESSVSPRDVERYGRHEFGRHMLQARRMLEAGVRFVKVNSYGWDTHADNFNGHASLMPRFDQAFAAMIEDLAERSMLENVLVISMSEFGRTPRINGSVGRDHWPEAWSLAMAGCGLKQGVVTGATNDQGTEVKGPAYDIGHMFHTWFTALGLDSKQQYDNQGQPLPIAHEDCHAAQEILSG